LQAAKGESVSQMLASTATVTWTSRKLGICLVLERESKSQKSETRGHYANFSRGEMRQKEIYCDVQKRRREPLPRALSWEPRKEGC